MRPIITATDIEQIVVGYLKVLGEGRKGASIKFVRVSPETATEANLIVRAMWLSTENYNSLVCDGSKKGIGEGLLTVLLEGLGVESLGGRRDDDSSDDVFKQLNSSMTILFCVIGSASPTAQD
ncbi:hypothetical protein ScalyP_jg4473 [Parmales sp. scaly parma]|nr:hypothetical protein ScalyP_jg4473 [Parmales sp. scaly parma]